MLAVTAAAFAEDSVRVYTNADLERLEPIPVSQRIADPYVGSGWEFVIDFIDSEQARLDVDRTQDLDRLLVDAEVQQLRDRRDRDRLRVSPFAGFFPLHFDTSLLHPRRPDNGEIVLAPDSANRITPMHARPTLAMRNRAIAIQRSGADSVPRRSQPIGRSSD